MPKKVYKKGNNIREPSPNFHKLCVHSIYTFRYVNMLEITINLTSSYAPVVKQNKKLIL